MPFARRAEIQKAMVSIGPQTAMGPHIGWKAGGTNAAAQKTLGLSGPFRERSALFCAAEARSLTEAVRRRAAVRVGTDAEPGLALEVALQPQPPRARVRLQAQGRPPQPLHRRAGTRTTPAPA